MTYRLFVLHASLVLIPSLARAQVGHEPRRTPYRDLENRQEFTLFAGQFSPRVDPARVAPTSGPLVGAHYEFRMTGPAYFTANAAYAMSERQVVDPTKLLADRFLGTKSANLFLLDVGFGINLTGFKSWRGIIPSLGGGVGVGSAFDSEDVGGYKVGYPFLVTLRPSIKFAPRGRWHGRIDATNYFFRIRYPDSYFTKSTADPAVLDPSASRNLWTRNLALSAGLTYTFGR